MSGLLHSRFDRVADNTIDYWMKKDTSDLTHERVASAIQSAPWQERSTMQMYLHVPYCAQHCSFCAFSGGNSLDFKSAEKYSRLLVASMQDLVASTQAVGKKIRAVNIGGGSPDLLKRHIGYVLAAVRDLPGVSDETELSVELTLSTARDEFIDELLKYNVTKASFGIQTTDPSIRKSLRMPEAMRNLDSICKRLAAGIPIINADLITGLPGQSVATVIEDLRFFMQHPHVNSISSYLLTAGAGPRLIGDIQSHRTAPPPSQAEQALFRLHSYSTLIRDGWIRKGTNTYMNPRKIAKSKLDMMAGNECIGARRYEDFLLGVGAQAISSLPGARVENTVDIQAWTADVERGRQSFALSKCSLEHQHDMALWVFPLMADGLAVSEYDAMARDGVLGREQIANFEAFIEEGLIVRSGPSYELSIVGEVFMGHLVRLLKTPEDRAVIDEYIQEGQILGSLLASSQITDANAANNRQIFKQLVSTSARSEAKRALPLAR
jgi:oxygen-independent coproporphyrinogen-3 oxidase